MAAQRAGPEPPNKSRHMYRPSIPDVLCAESIKQKLKRGTFPATFFLATLAALGMESVELDQI